MAKPRFSGADYASALQALLPTGAAWPRDGDAVQTKVVNGLTVIYERVDQSAQQVIESAFPLTATDMLPEWELTLGVSASERAATIQDRQQEILSRLIRVGGQSIDYFIGVSAAAGYTATVSENAPFRCGQSRCGNRLGSPEWFFVWRVNAGSVKVTSFKTGSSAVGEPLRSWGDSNLYQLLQKLKPAHTKLLVAYDTANLIDVKGGFFILDESILA